MRHLLLTGVMIVGALLAVLGTAELLERSERQHAAAQVEVLQPADVATPPRATPAIRKVAVSSD